MRTTIRIDDDLYREAKARAARQGRTVAAVIEDAVRRELRQRAPAEAEELEALPVYGGTGTLPGVDIADSRALRQIMDEGVTGDALR